MSIDIASTLKKKRKELGMSVNELLTHLKDAGILVSNKTVYGWESGHRQPDADTFIVLCRILGIESFDETEKSPSAEESAPGDQVTLEESNRLLVALGYIQEGDDLSDEDLAFLSHIVGLLDAWFRSKGK